jgi:hypothetical protein
MAWITYKEKHMQPIIAKKRIEVNNQLYSIPATDNIFGFCPFSDKEFENIWNHVLENNI